MITKIKNKLYNNKDLIHNILEELDCTYIKPTYIKNKEVFKFGHDSDSSGGANVLDIDTLHYHSFSNNTDGDIFTLTSEMKNISLGDSIKYLANILEIKFEYTQKEIKLPFMGFWKNLSKIKDNNELECKTYPKEIILKYSSHGVSKLWIEDNISALVQEEFQIGYDLETNRIVIPWINYLGELVGITARTNKKELTEDEKKYKYYSLIPFNKGKNLYGFYQNYKGILESNTIIICESEKAVLQAREYGYKNVVALGCNNITGYQEKLIKSMCCNVVLALDEGVSFQHCVEQINKCRIVNPFFTTELYILDMNRESNNNIKQEKVCVFDLSEKAIKNCFEEHLIYID